MNNLAGYWLSQGSRIPFADFVTPQAKVIAAGLAPKQSSTPEYAFNVNYGYHFDAHLVGEFLKELATGRGVTHLPARVARVEQRPEHQFEPLLGTADDQHLIEVDARPAVAQAAVPTTSPSCCRTFFITLTKEQYKSERQEGSRTGIMLTSSR